jgi:hypothetical protein
MSRRRVDALISRTWSRIFDLLHGKIPVPLVKRGTTKSAAGFFFDGPTMHCWS